MEIKEGFIMKRHIISIVAAAAALFTASCTKEAPIATPELDAPVQGGMKEVTITASIAPETKTSYDAEGKFSWTKGDQISVLADDGTFYTFTATASGATATFTGTIPAQAEPEKAAFFPADAEHTFVPGVEGAEDGSQYDSYYYNVPEYKDLSVVPSAGLPMGSYNSEGYVFTHMTGAALFTFTNIHEVFTAVEVSFSQALKFNGKFKTYVSNGVWSYFGAANATKGDSEASYTRKVKVENGKAKAYLPYPIATIWSGLTIDIKGIKADGSEVSLLTDLKTKQNIVIADRTTIIPITPIALPDYVPEADLSKIDWEAEGVAYVTNSSTSSDAILKELKVVADEYYMYVWIKSGTQSPYGGNFIDILLSDGNAQAEGAAVVWDQWPGTLGGKLYGKEHKGTIDADGNITSMTFNHNGKYEDIEFVNKIDEEINWYLIFPRSYIETYKSDTGVVYVGFRTWKDWGNFAAIPARGWGQSMLEVTLP